MDRHTMRLLRVSKSALIEHCLILPHSNNFPISKGSFDVPFLRKFICSSLVCHREELLLERSASPR